MSKKIKFKLKYKNARSVRSAISGKYEKHDKMREGIVIFLRQSTVVCQAVDAVAVVESENTFAISAGEKGNINSGLSRRMS